MADNENAQKPPSSWWRNTGGNITKTLLAFGALVGSYLGGRIPAEREHADDLTKIAATLDESLGRKPGERNASLNIDRITPDINSLSGHRRSAEKRLELLSEKYKEISRKIPSEENKDTLKERGQDLFFVDQHQVNEIYTNIYFAIKSAQEDAKVMESHLVVMWGETHPDMDSALGSALILKAARELGITHALMEGASFPDFTLERTPEMAIDPMLIKDSTVPNNENWKVSLAERIVQLEQIKVANHLGISVGELDIKYLDAIREHGTASSSDEAMNHRDKGMVEAIHNANTNLIAGMGSAHLEGVYNGLDGNKVTIVMFNVSNKIHIAEPDGSFEYGPMVEQVIIDGKEVDPRDIMKFVENARIIESWQDKVTAPKNMEVNTPGRP